MTQNKLSHLAVDAKDLHLFKVLAAERGITMRQLFHDKISERATEKSILIMGEEQL